MSEHTNPDSGEDNGGADDGTEALCQSEARLDDIEPEETELIYDPALAKRKGGRVDITGKFEDDEVIAWGFWAGLGVAAIAVLILLYGDTIMSSVLDTALVLLLLLVGLVVFELGRRSSLTERTLCEVDTRHQILSWKNRPGQVVAVAFEDVRAIKFARIRVPVRDSASKARLEVATLVVVDDRGRELPVVNASTSKEATHQVARAISELLGISVDYEGTGVREWV